MDMNSDFIIFLKKCLVVKCLKKSCWSYVKKNDRNNIISAIITIIYYGIVKCKAHIDIIICEQPSMN